MNAKKFFCVCLTLFALMTFVSCSKKTPMLQNSPIYLNEAIADSTTVLQSSRLVSALSSFSSDVLISEYKTDFVSVLYPIFSNEDIDARILDIIKNQADKYSSSEFTSCDFYLSYGCGAVTVVFYNCSETEPSFCITLSEDYSKIMKLEDFLKVDTLEVVCEKLYNKKPILDSNATYSFYVSENHITVRDANRALFDIPEQLFNNTPRREVFVGDDYLPVTDLNEKVIALTFDDGPNYYTTPELLKTLKEKDVKATFFVVGYNVPGNEHILRKMIEQDCDIGIHSYSHSNFYSMTKEQVMSDIKRCSDLVENATGIAPHLVRPPFGNIQDEIVKEKEYYYINWCVDPVDWNADSAEEIADHILTHSSRGAIVLLHDIHKISCDAAAIVIDKLKADGWRFVTISELLDLKNNEPSGEIYHSLWG